jgi:hypothetical protein
VKANSEAVRKVIDTIVENRTKFEAFCDSLSDEQLNRPVPESTWIVRDFAAHLDTLDPAMIALFEATVRGEQVRNPDGGSFDVDAFNDAAVAERRDWPLERVFAEAAGHRARLIEALAQLTDEQIAQAMHFAGDAKRPAGQIPLNLFLTGWAQHDPIHVFDMMRALPERADDAELKAWLDSPYVAGYQRAMNPA